MKKILFSVLVAGATLGIAQAQHYPYNANQYTYVNSNYSYPTQYHYTNPYPVPQIINAPVTIPTTYYNHGNNYSHGWNNTQYYYQQRVQPIRYITYYYFY
jgi:hypothetical protein